jgi:hypothetical protein
MRCTEAENTAKNGKQNQAKFTQNEQARLSPFSESHFVNYTENQ